MFYKSKIATVLLSVSSLFAFAQETKPAPTATQEVMMALAKASQNPVADMNTIPIQFNWFTGGGFGDQTMSQTLIQPVLPMAINEKWNVVSRTIVPILNIPVANDERVKGIADIQEQVYLSPKNNKKLIWGLGAVAQFPTSTIDEIATGQFAAGPGAVMLTMPGKWVLGFVANNIWRVGGSETTTAINAFFVQPFINYNLKGGWAFGTAPSITSNWSATSGQEWTVPVGANISKITLVGKQALSVNLEYYRNVARPDNAGENQIRMTVGFLFPR